MNPGHPVFSTEGTETGLRWMEVEPVTVWQVLPALDAEVLSDVCITGIF